MQFNRNQFPNNTKYPNNGYGGPPYVDSFRFGNIEGNGDIFGTENGDQICGDTFWTVDSSGRDYVVLITLKSSADRIDGLGGDDIIYGGYGDDIINGGVGDDRLYGDAGNNFLDGGPGNDILEALSGSSNLFGRDGDDRFYANPGLNDITNISGGRGNDTITGGNNIGGDEGDDLIEIWNTRVNGTAYGGTGSDTIRGELPIEGRFAVWGDSPAEPDQYGIDYLHLASNSEGLVYKIDENSAGSLHVSTISVNGAPRFDIHSDIERVKLGFNVTNANVDFKGTVYDDLARMADHAYSDISLNMSGGSWTGAGWRPVSAIELGLQMSGGKTKNGIDYSMRQGIYRAEGAVGEDNGAVAHVYAANGFLLVAFRGTDSLGDIIEWSDTSKHFERFQPLVDAIKSSWNPGFGGNEASSWGDILITGYSLGGAAAQLLHSELNQLNSFFNGCRIITATFGSPGAQLRQIKANYDSITHFELTQDIVPFAGTLAAAAGNIGDFLQTIPNAITIASGSALSKLTEEGSSYKKQGTVIRIPDGNSQLPGISSDEHDRTLYVDKVNSLANAINDGLLQLNGRTVGSNGGRTFDWPFENPTYRSIVAGSGVVEADASPIVYSSGKVYGDGNDLILGSELVDTLKGHAGRDVLVGVSGADLLEGGSGDDNFVLSWIKGVGTRLVDFMPGDSLTLTDMPSLIGVTATLQEINGINSLTVSIASHGSRSFTIGSSRINNPNFIYEANTHGPNTITTYFLGGNVYVAPRVENDLIFGGRGNDTLEGGEGDDVLVGGNGRGDDWLIGGAGTDTVTYRSALGSITVDLSSGSTNGSSAGLGTDRLQGIEHVEGGDFADKIVGGEAANRLAGFTGNDTLNGAAGADTLLGGAGNDLLDSAGQDDLIEGGSGDDRIAGGPGQDTASYGSAELGVSVSLDTGRANGGGGADTLEGIEHLRGSDFADSLIGNAEANHLEGDAGGDTLEGDAGNDTLSGGVGADTFGGGTGNDLFFVTDAGDVVIELAGGGADTIIASVNVTMPNQVEVLQIASGISGITITGGAGNDMLIGNGLANTFVGGEGDDVILVGNVTLADINALFAI
jgi:Ca2+-binding RTX toxin-like protein